MTVFTLAAVTVTGGARITVTTATDPAITYTLSRVREDTGDESPVLGAVNVAAAGTVWDDYATELSVPVHYVAVLSTGETFTSNTVLVESEFPILSDPYLGRSVQVRVVAGGETSWKSRATTLEVEGRRDPLVLWDVLSVAYRAPVLITDDKAGLEAIRAVLAAGGPVLLRAPCRTVEDGWMVPLSGITEAPLGQSEAVLHTFGESVVLLAPPEVWRRAAGDTLGDLHAAVPGTLGDIAATWSTLGEIAIADLAVM